MLPKVCVTLNFVVEIIDISIFVVSRFDVCFIMFGLTDRCPVIRRAFNTRLGDERRYLLRVNVDWRYFSSDQ